MLDQRAVIFGVMPESLNDSCTAVGDPDLADHERMAAALALLVAQLAEVAPRLLAGQVDQAECHRLAAELEETARRLRERADTV